MALTLITPPSGRVLTVAEARRQLLQNSSVGEPAPAAPTVALASPAVAGNVTAGAHRYRVTCVTADGETDGGDVSAIVTVADAGVNGKVELTGIAVGGTNVTSRKIYRTSAGGSTYLLLATIADNTTTVYTDNIADGSLGAEAPSTNTTEDPDILRWIDSAEIRGQRVSRRQFRTATWDLVLDHFPSCGVIEIPKPPLQSITYVKYRDTAGDLQTWDAANYTVEAPAGDFCQHGRLTLAYGISWPSLYGQAGDVQIRFVAGYGAASDVPTLLKEGMLIAVADRSAQRESIVTGAIVAKIPGTADDIFKAFRVFSSAPLSRRVA
jgi:uncharacterized phiE125 gp8 family phage protein